MALSQVPPRIPPRRKYPNNPTREVFEAAKSGDAVLLNEVLQEMNSSERAAVVNRRLLQKLNFRQGCGSLITKGESTPLIVAAGNGNLDCVKVLLKYNANIESRGHIFYKTIYHKVSTSPLIAAAGNGHVDVLRFLLEHGADVNACANDNYSLLMIASFFGHVDVVNFLVQHKANTDLQDKDGFTALHRALSHNHGSCDVLSCLIKNGADVNAHTNDSCTPLMIASENGHLNAVSFLIEHGANIDLQDEKGYTTVHYAVGNDCDSCDVLSCLIKHGANVNACTNDNYTPLMVASDSGNVDVVNCLIQHGANIQLQDKDGKTALHHAVHLEYTSFNVLSSLIKSGGDVNSCTNENCTPLMIASYWGYVNLVAFLIEHGADMDLQDTNGNTALHYAVRAIRNSTEIVYTLVSLGASQLHNSKGLTPLLLASNNCNISVVEDLIKRPECTKEQRVDALELLGASFPAASVSVRQLRAARAFCNIKSGMEERQLQATKSFCYIKRGMEERFADPSHPLLKQSMEPVEAYQNRKESQTLQELAQIESDIGDIIMECLIIRERILGTNSALLLCQIRCAADFYSKSPFICIELHRRAMKIAQGCNKSAFHELCKLTFLLSDKSMWRGEVFLELLEQTVLEYDKQQKLSRGLENESRKLLIEETLEPLFASTMKLLGTIAKFINCDEGKTLNVLVFLKRLCCLNPRDESGDTLLHHAVERVTTDGFPCPDIVKLLLSAGFNVNAVNSNGYTPLHRAATFKPSNNAITDWTDESHHWTDMLKILLDGGAHHDFVNNDGKTAMDLAKTFEARVILAEERKLELKCISARAVKKFGLPYLGMVPGMLEKYIEMH